jgi:hypothetical protein
MWNRWKAGKSLHEIGRVFGKDHVSIHYFLAQHGGIVTAARRHSRSHWQSEKISREESLPVRRFVRSPKACSGNLTYHLH